MSTASRTGEGQKAPSFDHRTAEGQRTSDQTPMETFNAIRFAEPIVIHPGRMVTADYDATSEGVVIAVESGADEVEVLVSEEQAVSIATQILYAVSRGRALRMPAQIPMGFTEGTRK